MFQEKERERSHREYSPPITEMVATFKRVILTKQKYLKLLSYLIFINNFRLRKLIT
jgi:hypothetical protein